jgi:hypothetical protein
MPLFSGFLEINDNIPFSILRPIIQVRQDVTSLISRGGHGVCAFKHSEQINVDGAVVVADIVDCVKRIWNTQGCF